MSSSRVPFLNLRSFFAEHRDEVLTELVGLMERGEFIGGGAVQRFEKAFSQWLGESLFTVGCGNGTDAITLAALALSLPPGAEAIVPAMTFFATLEGLRNAGVKLRVVDIEEGTWLIDTRQVEKALSGQVKLLVPVHLYGQMANMVELRRMADRASVQILEDAAQAHGAMRAGKTVGQLGDVAAFSFYPGKNLGAFGDAGAVVSRRQAIADGARRLGSHGSVEKYKHEVWGYNSRLDAMQAAVLDLKLKYIDEWNRKRRQVATWYRQVLSGIPGLQLPTESADAQHVYHLFVVLVEKRDQFRAHLGEKGIESGLHYPSAVHQLAACRDESFFQGNFPVASRLAAHGVSLPMCPTLTEAQVEWVGKSVREYFSL